MGDEKREDIHYCMCGHKFVIISENITQFKKALKISEKLHRDSEMTKTMVFVIDMTTGETPTITSHKKE